MSETTYYRFVTRRRTASSWISLNEVLLQGEIGVELDGAKRSKVGDGISTWLDLPFSTVGSIQDLDTIADGQVLVWDAITHAWKPGALGGGLQLSSANVFTNVQTVAPYAASISGAVSIDLAGTAKSNTLVLTAAANVTSLAFTNPVDGAIYNIYLAEDATGGWVWPALPSNFDFGAAGAPTLTTTAGAINQLSMQWIAVLSKFRGAGSAG